MPGKNVCSAPGLVFMSTVISIGGICKTQEGQLVPKLIFVQYPCLNVLIEEAYKQRGLRLASNLALVFFLLFHQYWFNSKDQRHLIVETKNF